VLVNAEGSWGHDEGGFDRGSAGEH